MKIMSYINSLLNYKKMAYVFDMVDIFNKDQYKKFKIKKNPFRKLIHKGV